MVFAVEFSTTLRMKMRKNIVLIVVLFVLLFSVANAHQWFAALEETREYKAGDTVPLVVYSTHHFMVGEGIQDASRNAFFVLQDNKLTNTTVRTTRDEAKNSLTGSFTLPAGAPTMVVVNSVGRVANSTPLGSKAATKATVKAMGVSIAKTTFSEGWCKIYVNPSSQDKSFDKALGLPLEIVPVTNPTDMAIGKPAMFKVLLHGKPLRDTAINATYKSYNSKDEEAWAVKDIKTDANGQVTINIPSAQNARDIWIVKAAYTGPVSGNPEYEEESYNSLVIFTVRK